MIPEIRWMATDGGEEAKRRGGKEARSFASSSLRLLNL
jgi:hypothetical protein